MTRLSSLLLDLFSALPKQTQLLGGSGFAEVLQITLANGRAVVVKQKETPSTLFQREAEGLLALAGTQSLRVPEVLYVDKRTLILESIETGRRSPDFDVLLGRGLAKLHKTTADRFGFAEDNWLGGTPQPNKTPEPVTSWLEFFWSYRLEHQWRLALQTPGGDTLSGWMKRLERRLPAYLDGTEEAPALLHGDLWAGNVLADERGAPCLIDPAAYFGHREAEFGMTTLFGGFSEGFVHAYEEVFPLSEGWRERNKLYQLVHLLNHWNLFGGSYLTEAIEVLKRLV